MKPADLSWMTDAACARTDAEAFWPAKGVGTGAEARLARRTCARCYARLACLTWAITTKQPSGIYGGLSEKQRRAWTVTPSGELAERDPRGEVAA